MARASDLVKKESSEQVAKKGFREGKVISSPATLADGVRVSIEESDHRFGYGPCPWMPRGDILPQAGDRALLVMSDDNQPWVIAWWPQEA